MDINTTYSIQKGWLPERFYNQLDKEQSIEEVYVSEKQRAYDEIVGDPESKETVVSINTTYKEI